MCNDACYKIKQVFDSFDGDGSPSYYATSEIEMERVREKLIKTLAKCAREIFLVPNEPERNGGNTLEKQLYEGAYEAARKKGAKKMSINDSETIAREAVKVWKYDDEADYWDEIYS